VVRRLQTGGRCFFLAEPKHYPKAEKIKNKWWTTLQNIQPRSFMRLRSALRTKGYGTGLTLVVPTNTEAG